MTSTRTRSKAGCRTSNSKWAQKFEIGNWEFSFRLFSTGLSQLVRACPFSGGAFCPGAASRGAQIDGRRSRRSTTNPSHPRKTGRAPGECSRQTKGHFRTVGRTSSPSFYPHLRAIDGPEVRPTLGLEIPSSETTVGHVSNVPNWQPVEVRAVDFGQVWHVGNVPHDLPSHFVQQAACM
jgi:hypothetical protein